MADSHFNLAISHSILAISSGWSLIQCNDLKFARVAFGLYLMNGIAGLVTYAVSMGSNDDSYNLTKKALQNIRWISYALCLPLLVAEVYHNLSTPTLEACAFLVLPLYVLLAYSYHAIMLDCYNSACVLALLLVSTSPLNISIALMYSTLHCYNRCFPHAYLFYFPRPACQYIQSVINVLVVYQLKENNNINQLKEKYTLF